MAQTVIEMGVKLKVAITSGFNTILPTTMDDLSPTKKAKEGHDLQLSVVTSSDNINFGPLGANAVVAKPMRAVPKADHVKIHNDELILQPVLDADQVSCSIGSNGGSFGSSICDGS